MYNVYSKTSILKDKDKLCASCETIDEAIDYCKWQRATYRYTDNDIIYYRCSPTLEFYIIKE